MKTGFFLILAFAFGTLFLGKTSGFQEAANKQHRFSADKNINPYYIIGGGFQVMVGTKVPNICADFFWQLSHRITNPVVLEGVFLASAVPVTTWIIYSGFANIARGIFFRENLKKINDKRES